MTANVANTSSTHFHTVYTLVVKVPEMESSPNSLDDGPDGSVQ